MNRNCDLTEQRDRAVYALYKRLVESGGFVCAEQIYGTIASLPAPRHYMDSRTAAGRLGELRGGKVLKGPASGRWYRLYADWLALPEGERLPLAEACERLLDRPAPSFYLSPRAVRAAVARLRRKEREELYAKAGR